MGLTARRSASCKLLWPEMPLALAWHTGGSVGELGVMEAGSL